MLSLGRLLDVGGEGYTGNRRTAGSCGHRNSPRSGTRPEAQPRHIKSDWVFTNPETEEAWKDVRKVFRRACKAVKLTGVWFHDLRRSLVTNARRRGVPESVVMRMSGHRTRAVFDRYNIVEEDDLRDAVKRIEAGIAKSSGASGQDLDKVKGG